MKPVMVILNSSSIADLHTYIGIPHTIKTPQTHFWFPTN